MINRCISDKWYRIRGNFFLVMIVLCAFASCVSVPKAAVGMSVQLEQQLYALQQATNSIVEKAYQEKEKNVVAYIDNIWYPRYVEELFQQPVIVELWDEVVRTDSLVNRMELIKMLTQSCMTEYLSYKKSLLAPVEEEKASILKSLNESYGLALRMNGAIAKNLASSRALQDEYNSYLSKVTSPERLDSVIVSSFERIDREIEKIEKGTDKLRDAGEKVKEFIDYIKE